MSRKDIIRMAQEAGFVVDEKSQQHQPNCIFHTHHMVDELLTRFAALVAAAERNSWPAEMEAMERQVNILTDGLAQAKAEEREACAKVCDALSTHYWAKDDAIESVNCEECATAIRARGNA